MRWLILFLSILCNSLTQGQISLIKNNELFDVLMKNQTGPVSIIQGVNFSTFTKISDDKNINHFPHHLVKNNNALYLLVERTGRVFQIQKHSKEYVQLMRVDSTHFYGYNGSAILFSYNDTIFSFGGDGFWKKNGQLRYFSFSTHEWEILPINIEIPTTNFLFYFNDKKHMLYYTVMPYIDPATNENHQEAKIYKLDLTTRKNTKLGNMSGQLLKLFSGRDILDYSIVSLNQFESLLVNLNIDNQYIFSFENNSVYKINNHVLRNTFYGNSERKVPIFQFSKQNQIYFTRLFDSTFSIDSIKFELKDLMKEPYPLYETPTEINSKGYAVLLTLILLSAAGIFYYKKSKGTFFGSVETEKVLNVEDEGDTLKFNAIEHELIQKMIEAARSKKQFSVENINVSLGLGKKSLEIQKKGRTEAINRINHKFKVIYDVKVDLIERIRSEEDRRFYKYTISEEHAKMLRG